MNKQLSVVIPTYKRPALLAKCLEALKRQTLDSEITEIIVVSDGPDADTAHLLQNWPQVRYLPTAQKKGPAAARNHGWKNATATIVAFTDDDCLPEEDWLLNFYNNVSADEPAALTGRTVVPVSDDPTDYERNTAGLETADFITANCCCTKKALIITGGFDEEFAMAWREDSDLHFKLMMAGVPIRKVEKAVIVHPVREAVWGVSLKEQRKTIYNALLYKKYPDLYREKIQPDPPIRYYAILGSFILALAGFFTENPNMLLIGTVCWLSLSLLFIFIRLRNTSRTPGHFIEMVVTSLLIPFLSIYWQCYGAVKYRVLFI